MSRELYLETEHLYLYVPIEEDFEFIRQKLRDPKMTDYVDGAIQEPQIERMITRNKKQWKNYPFGVNILFLKKNGERIGYAGAKYWPPDTTDAVDIGFGTTPEYQRRGLTFEAVSAVIKDCFDRHHFSILNCHTSTNNVPAMSLIEKLGFKKVKIVDVEADGITYRNIAFFELTREEFTALHNIK